MSNFCLKIGLILLLVILSLGILSTSVYADRIINSVSLDGSASVTVDPSTPITAAISVTTDSLNDKNWRSTSWNISGSNCVDHADHNGAGTYSENFTVTAPSSPGTYNISFIAYADSSCSQEPSPTYTLTNGIIVNGPTPTPTPTSTTTPTPSSSSDNSSSATAIFPSLNLKRQGVQFIGTASISEGTIDLVEYSLDSGNTWSQASPSDGKFDEISEDYFFSPQEVFSVGEHKILVRARSLAQVYTQSSSYASLTVTVSPPSVRLDEISPNPTKNQTPTITGSASSDFAKISFVQISLDDGKSWLPAKLNGTRFTLTTESLGDGNYPVKARAFDTAGNVAETETQILIVDTIPPIIGGNMFSIGLQTITPSEKGVIRTVVGTKITLTVSMEGGVTEAKIVSNGEEFGLEPLQGTNLWSANLIYKNAGQHLLTIKSVDGAGNATKRELNYILIDEPGKVFKKDSDEIVSEAKIQLYFFDTITQNWILWDAASFGQENPQLTNERGEYSFLIPTGKYYIEVSAVGYKKTRSQIFNLDDNTILNANFSLETKPTLKLNLPFYGEIILSMPSFRPPETINVNFKQKATPQLDPKQELGYLAPTLAGITLPKGKHVISFISTWSNDSLEQIPILSEAQKQFENQLIIGVFLQESEGRMKTFLRRGGYTFTAFADKNGESANNFPITTLPQHFFINSTGELVEIYNGVLTKEELLSKLNSLE